MKIMGQMLIIYLFCVIALLLIALNVNNYNKWQNKTQNNLVEQLY